ncbi:MAG: alanine racemase [candidate division Zixibacteria bacterium]|nr:alanine racemase [candidate division Zixibacteria bacterium]
MKFSSSVIELSKSALNKNIRFIKKQLGPNVIFSSVVKGNAYGHGIEEFVPLAEGCGIRHFSVFSAEEALRVYESRSENSNIMIMGCVDNMALEWAIENDINFYVFNLERLEQAKKIALRQKKIAKIHLELETGLNRTGLNEEQLDQAARIILENSDCLRVEGVCTHFAGAESIANYKRIIDQHSLFEKQCFLIENTGLKIGVRHTAASAAALTYPETRMDMVRIGIAQYGFWPSRETEMQYILRGSEHPKNRYVDPLKRVLRWKSHIMDLSDVSRGDFVGYGTLFQSQRKLKVAAVPIGYFHGFRRSLSNLGRVLIHGKRVGVVGNVNMNMLLVNVSEVDDPKVGDEVVIIGKQKRSQITVSSFSDMSNLLNYEALVRLPSEIPRIVVD